MSEISFEPQQAKLILLAHDWPATWKVKKNYLIDGHKTRFENYKNKNNNWHRIDWK